MGAKSTNNIEDQLPAAINIFLENNPLNLGYYRKSNSDLCHLDDIALVKHWYNYGCNEGRAGEDIDAKNHLGFLKLHPLDTGFYQQMYPDLKSFDNAKLLEHWVEFGSSEGRIGQIKDLFSEAGDYFDKDFYGVFYDDLVTHRNAGVHALLDHYKFFGQPEQRYKNIGMWIDAEIPGSHVDNYPLSIAQIQTLNESKGVSLVAEEIVGLFLGALDKCISLFEEPDSNADFYKILAEYYSVIDDSQAARTALKISMFFEIKPEVLVLIGDQYFNDNMFGVANSYYEKAVDLGYNARHVPINRVISLGKIGSVSSGIEVLKQELARNPQHTFLLDTLDEWAEKAWQELGGQLEVHAITNDREAILTKVQEYGELIYRSYFRAFGASVEPEQLKVVDGDRILIIGELGLPQCLRYRIEQKVEQLSAQGKTVSVVNWLDLDDASVDLATYDIVIFYRVPATPAVLKAMAQTNVTGKLSIYEIDDYLFEPLYPTSIDSYGGYVGVDTYLNLIKGMAYLNVAAKHCRLGLTSTIPLSQHLARLVFGRECLIHRNGLDHYHSPQLIARDNNQYIDIFYGSGTQAHNADFVDLALPAITKVMVKHSNVRLVIAGYLNLPSSFSEQFGERYLRLPMVDNLDAYYSILSNADINLAVLHDDEINSCKSELKWFEAACFGIPSVLSATQNYRQVINDGVDGVLAVNSDDWEVAIEKFIVDREFRTCIGSNAYHRVLSEYSVERLGRSMVTLLNNYLLKNNAAKPAAKKKLAIVNVFYSPQIIGGATRIVGDNVNDLLAAYGDKYEVCIFCADGEPREPYRLTTYMDGHQRVYRTTVEFQEKMDWFPRNESIEPIFEQFLELEKPDLVHFHCIQRLTGTVVDVTRRREIPYIITAHDAWWISDYQFLVDAEGEVYPDGHTDPYHQHLLPDNITRGESYERLLYLKSLLSDAKHTLTVSEGFADIFRKNGVENIQVTKNGISNQIDWKPKDTAYTNKVVCAHIGSMSEHKGYYLLRNAVLETQSDNIEFIVVDHSKDNAYFKRACWGDVPVTYIGHVKAEAIQNLYAKIDVLFAPSLWPESFGLVTREAAACGCWVVASNLGGIGENVDDGVNGFCIEPTQAELENVLQTINSDVKRFKSLAPATAVRFADAQVKELVALYND